MQLEQVRPSFGGKSPSDVGKAREGHAGRRAEVKGVDMELRIRRLLKLLETEAKKSENLPVLPAVPHKAVAEVSEYETYRRGWLL